MTATFAARIAAAATFAEAGDLFLEARAKLDRDSQAWRDALDAMQAQVKADDRPIEPLVSFRPSGW